MISTVVLPVVVRTECATKRRPMPDLGACLRARTVIEAAARDELSDVAERTFHVWCETPKPEITS